MTIYRVIDDTDCVLSTADAKTALDKVIALSDEGKECIWVERVEVE